MKYTKYKYKSIVSRPRHKTIPLPKTQRALSNKNSVVMAVKIFNSLPSKVKNRIFNKKTFKICLKPFM